MEIVGNDTGLENDQQIDRIDFENQIHPSHRYHDAAGNGDCAPGIADSTAARNHWNGFTICETDNLGNLFRITGKNDHIGRMESLRGIGAVFPNRVGIGADMVGSDDKAELF
jgi:hypothetical protein